MPVQKQMYVIKEDGNRVPFDESRLRRSLAHAGAKEDVQDRIVSHIGAELYDGISTRDIYRHAFALLRKEEKPLAAHYSMKRAILALGPSGFPFERFVAEIFKRKGFTTSVDVDARGMCTRHEVDVVAKKAETCIGAELKFHNQLGTKSDIKDALYVKARFDDIILWQKKNSGNDLCINEGWFITNTSLTKHARVYGHCAGLRMISWSYPKQGSLEDLINETGVQPVTCLTSLSGSDKMRLMEKDIVLCQNVHQDPGVLLPLGIERKKMEAAIAESKAVCGT